MSGVASPEVIELIDVLRLLAKDERVRMDRQHGEQHKCPVCSDDMMRVAVVEIAYTFEVCGCGEPKFNHLVEQLWHRRCFVRSDLNGVTS